MIDNLAIFCILKNFKVQYRVYRILLLADIVKEKNYFKSYLLLRSIVIYSSNFCLTRVLIFSYCPNSWSQPFHIYKKIFCWRPPIRMPIYSFIYYLFKYLLDINWKKFLATCKFNGIKLISNKYKRTEKNVE